MRLRAALVQAAAALAATAAAQVPAGCIADRNYDRSVTVLDLLLVLGGFGAVAPSDGAAVGDISGDGIVDIADVLLTLSSFGVTGCAPPVPVSAPGVAPSPGPTRPPPPPAWGAFAGGRVFGMGDNDDGRLGVGDSGNHHHSPVEAVGFGSDVVQIAAAGHVTFALRADGSVFASGLNDLGTLGDGTTSSRSSGAQITAIGTDTVELAQGLFSSMVVRKADGTIAGWGNNDMGELCLGNDEQQLTPLVITSLGSDNARIGSGCNHIFHMKTDGSVVGCGYNYWGNLGDGTYNRRTSPVPLPALTGATQIVGGYAHTVALHADGTVSTFGKNEYAQLGDGCVLNGRHQCTNFVLIPAVVQSLGSDNAMVGAGNRNSMVMKQDGRVFTVGYGWSGCLGVGDSDSDRASSSIFVQALVGSDNQAAVLSSNSHHILVLKNDGTVAGWGSNGEGQLGSSPTGGQPAVITELSNDNYQLASQYHFSVVLKNT